MASKNDTTFPDITQHETVWHKHRDNIGKVFCLNQLL